MSRTLRSRITYANVMSTLAVFIALGGGAWAVSGRSAASNGRERGATASAAEGNKLIHACADDGNGALRISRKCGRGEHRVNWVDFNGHFQSPNGEWSLDITDNGIQLHGEAGPTFEL